MKYLLTVFASLVMTAAAYAQEAQKQPCYSTFYQTHNMDCVDELVVIANTLSSGAEGNETANHQPIVGFFAEFFSTYPQEKEHFTKRAETPYSKQLCLEALFRAGMVDEAQQFAAANNMSEIAKRYTQWRVPTLQEVTPKSLPAENDLLIGAYLASGKQEYIKRILSNYSSATDGMVSDALRMSFLHSKFGASMTPKGRKTSIGRAACEKYKCKENDKEFMRLMTLATAHWATASLAARHEGIKTAVIEFFNSDEHLKKLFISERATFGNYLTLLASYAAIRESKEIDKALTIYESFGSSKAFTEALPKGGVEKKQ